MPANQRELQSSHAIRLFGQPRGFPSFLRASVSRTRPNANQTYLKLTEYEIPWLPGYGGSRPVRIGNAAHEQLQLDVYGELMDALHAANRYGLEASPFAWSLQVNLLEYLETIWEQPDQGIWEIRGEPRHFTFSKVMAWVAFDRAIKSVEQYGFEGPRAHWEDLRRGLPRRSSSVASTAIATPSSNTTALAISTPRCC